MFCGCLYGCLYGFPYWMNGNQPTIRSHRTKADTRKLGSSGTGMPNCSGPMVPDTCADIISIVYWSIAYICIHTHIYMYIYVTIYIYMLLYIYIYVTIYILYYIILYCIILYYIIHRMSIGQECTSYQ